MSRAPRTEAIARPVWRLIVDPPADGAWNMAMDEALLEDCLLDPESRAPTLRLYGWSPACLSLGRSQQAAGAHDPRFLRAEGIDLVRRPTGGQAVLHEFERTYAVVARLGAGSFPRSVRETYAAVAGAILDGLSRLGVAGALAAPGVSRSAPPGTPSAVCFSSPSIHEIVVEGRKIVGSAQLRRRGAFVQHGSILIRADPGRLARAIGQSASPTGFIDLERVLGGTVDRRELDDAVVRGFESRFGVTLRRGPTTPRELETATRLRSRKYLSTRWTLEGRAPVEDRTRPAEPCP